MMLPPGSDVALSAFLVVSGAAVLLLGLGLIWIGRWDNPPKFMVRLQALTAEVGATDWTLIPKTSLGVLGSGISRYVDFWYRQSDKNVAVGGAVMIITFAAIPIAVVLNVLRGGNPFLLWVLIAIVAGMALLSVVSETGRARGFGSLLSLGVYLAGFVSLPAYIFVSLTDRMLNSPALEAALGSLVVASLVYLIAQAISAMLSPYMSEIGHKGKPIAEQLHLFAGALPLAYILAFNAQLLTGGEGAANLFPSWASLLIWCGLLAFTASLSHHLLATVRYAFLAGLLGVLVINAALQFLALTWLPDDGGAVVSWLLYYPLGVCVIACLMGYLVHITGSISPREKSGRSIGILFAILGAVMIGGGAIML
ncbi:MAG: hypothetical protein VW169_02035 [Rhodospirillaceae bacterium]|jgi:hypothetical protein